MPNEKEFLYLLSTPSGSYYGLTKEANLPDFSDSIGSGQSHLTVTLPRKWGSLGVPGDSLGTDDIVLDTTGSSTVSIYVIDQTTLALGGGTVWGAWTWGTSRWGDPPAGLGQLLYQGTFEETEVALGKSADALTVTLVPPHFILSATFDDSITFTDTDPIDVARHFFDAGYLPTLTWDTRNPTTSGRAITQKFEYQKYRDILDFCTTACGSGWINHVDERGRFRLWSPDTTATPDHTVQVGRELVEGKYLRTQVARYNQVIVRGKGETTYNISNGTLSGATVDSTFASTTDPVNGGTVSGMQLTVTTPAIISNVKGADWSRATARCYRADKPEIDDQATADLVASLLLARLNAVAVRATLTLVSNSGDLTATAISYDGGLHTYPSGQLTPTSSRGYVLESVRPGDTILLNLDQGDSAAWIWGAATWGTSRWTGGQLDLVQMPQVVSAVRYHGGDTIDVDLSTPQPSIRGTTQALQTLVESALASAVG